MMTQDLDWRNAHRIRLHHFANNKSDESFTFLAPDFNTPTANLAGANSQKPLNTAQERTEMKEDTISTEQANRFFYDMALAGEPIQCLEEDGTCEALRCAMPSSDQMKADK
jgi:beta-1,2-xylosyltransferase